ncbi:glycosyltransferase family 4 protein [Desulfoluna butyratoxydans]|uniref:Glycosyl transferase family 1 n=1 Tax=Desulfoluna butyratoxydans TaxID=231438 RepID=A0A4U8YT68_9BACT|nr:glycosyltransferase family 4 protein [Desulfoluna butyratoxydans]VFQ46559.1 glycosyl transferase family 1 [Desulfoluna butyratoxydans]
MKILLINKFLYPKGGDAISTLTTGEVLSQKKHEVFYWGMEHPDNPKYQYEEYFVSNVSYDSDSGFFHKSKAAMNVLYSLEAARNLSALLKVNKPDIVHLNNFAHQISPSILSVIKSHDIPIVMTMHDYKMVCPTYSMLCGGNVCEKCQNGQFYHCGIKRCTKGSFFKSLVNVVEMYLHHALLNIYGKIDLYISPSEFLKSKVTEMGLKGKIVHLPNFVDLSLFKPSFGFSERRIVYVGRLSQEKGVETLIDAVCDSNLQLTIIGDGPLRAKLQDKVEAHSISNIEFLGYISGQALHNEIQKAMFLVIPSEWYENNPLTVIEAFALGKPVLGARIGGIPELVKDWATGLTFTSGDVVDLRNKIQLLVRNEEKLFEMGQNARLFVEKELNEDVFYRQLVNIYQSVM